jgi:hypothetical protein
MQRLDKHGLLVRNVFRDFLHPDRRTDKIVCPASVVARVGYRDCTIANLPSSNAFTDLDHFGDELMPSDFSGHDIPVNAVKVFQITAANEGASRLQQKRARLYGWCRHIPALDAPLFSRSNTCPHDVPPRYRTLVSFCRDSWVNGRTRATP